jgi:hypothetical protein
MERLANQRQQRAMLSLSIDNALSKKEAPIGFTPRTHLKTLICRVDALTKTKLANSSCVGASPHDNQDSFLSARSTAVDDDAGPCADDAQAVSFMFTPRLATVEENMYVSEKGFDHVFEEV